MADFCSNCGTENKGGSFCAACGTPISSATSSKNAEGIRGGGSNAAAMWSHLAPLLLIPLSGGSLVWLGWLAPLIIRTSNPDDPYTYDQATKSINFQIQWLIIYAAIGVFGVFTCGVGWFLFIPAGIFQLVAMIMATVSSTKGDPFKYPMQFMNLVK